MILNVGLFVVMVVGLLSFVIWDIATDTDDRRRSGTEIPRPPQPLGLPVARARKLAREVIGDDFPGRPNYAVTRFLAGEIDVEAMERYLDERVGLCRAPSSCTLFPDDSAN